MDRGFLHGQSQANHNGVATTANVGASSNFLRTLNHTDALAPFSHHGTGLNALEGIVEEVVAILGSHNAKLNFTEVSNATGSTAAYAGDVLAADGGNDILDETEAVGPAGDRIHIVAAVFFAKLMDGTNKALKFFASILIRCAKGHDKASCSDFTIDAGKVFHGQAATEGIGANDEGSADEEA